MFEREDIHVVVVGGETNGYWRIISGRLGANGIGRRVALSGVLLELRSGVAYHGARRAPLNRLSAGTQSVSITR